MKQVKKNTQHSLLHINKFTLFYIVSCLEGAAVMIGELAGAKLIAPFYGNSLYVWTSVLGTTLIGLASGYYLGGIVSKKYGLQLISEDGKAAPLKIKGYDHFSRAKN